MTRFWISWFSGGYGDEGCKEQPPFQYWWTGQRDRLNYGLSAEKYAVYLQIKDEAASHAFIDVHGRADGSACAMVEANNKDEIWPVIARYFPDYKFRFCEECDPDCTPGDRFPNYENRVSLYV
jgi:hypothetical protein